METQPLHYFKISIAAGAMTTHEVTAGHERAHLTLPEALEACAAALPPGWDASADGWITLRIRPTRAPKAPTQAAPSRTTGAPRNGHCPGCGCWKKLSAQVAGPHQCDTCNAIDEGHHRSGGAA